MSDHLDLPWSRQPCRERSFAGGAVVQRLGLSRPHLAEHNRTRNHRGPRVRSQHAIRCMGTTVRSLAARVAVMTAGCEAHGPEGQRHRITPRHRWRPSRRSLAGVAGCPGPAGAAARRRGDGPDRAGAAVKVRQRARPGLCGCRLGQSGPPKRDVGPQCPRLRESRLKITKQPADGAGEEPATGMGPASSRDARGAVPGRSPRSASRLLSTAAGRRSGGGGAGDQPDGVAAQR